MARREGVGKLEDGEGKMPSRQLAKGCARRVGMTRGEGEIAQPVRGREIHTGWRSPRQTRGPSTTFGWRLTSLEMTEIVEGTSVC